MDTNRKQREWTPEQRAEQSRKLRERKIWQSSTGPRTAEGKAISSQNGLKHGGRSRHRSAFNAVLRKFAEMAKIYTFLNHRKNKMFLTTELIDHLKREAVKMSEDLFLTYELLCMDRVLIDERLKKG